jgi:hypothetical protein
MRHKILSVLLIVILLLSIVPLSVSASTINISDTTYDISTATAGDSIHCSGTVTLTGTNAVTIECEAGTTLTLDNVTIDVSSTEGACALQFTGTGNTLILVGLNSLTSGKYAAGIQVESDSEITIQGIGNLNVTGGQYGAGIGGGDSFMQTFSDTSVDAGTINIVSGTIIAQGGEGAAGIGGGDYGSLTELNISGGIIDATGGTKGAGIGAGDHADNGTINISGGRILAAAGGDLAAGIGGGQNGYGGDLIITGGYVYAKSTKAATPDIGTGQGGSAGTISITGDDSALFLYNDSMDYSSFYTDHVHEVGTLLPGTNSDVTGVVDLYGLYIYVVTAWEDAEGGWYPGHTLTYDPNTGTGSEYYVAANGEVFNLSDGSGFSKEGYTLIGWNTQADGLGTAYALGEEYTMPDYDVTLYAVWEANTYVLSYDANGGSGTIADQNVKTDETINLSDGSGFSKDGYTLTGWNTEADGSGTSYALGGSFTMPPNDETLYAVWEANTYVLSYDANGGSGTIADQNFKTDEKVILSDGSAFSKDLYDIAGWSTQSGDNSVEYLLGEVFTMPPHNETLYAVWELKSDITATLDIEGYVKDTSGNPLSGITVVLNSTPRTTITDINGYYRFDDVTIEQHYLTFRRGTEVLGIFTLDISPSTIDYADLSNDGSSGEKSGEVNVGISSVNALLQLNVIVNEDNVAIIDNVDVIDEDAVNTVKNSDNPKTAGALELVGYFGEGSTQVDIMPYIGILLTVILIGGVFIINRKQMQ